MDAWYMLRFLIVLVIVLTLQILSVCLIKLCSGIPKNLNKCLRMPYCPWIRNTAKIQLFEKQRTIWLMAAWYMLRFLHVLVIVLTLQKKSVCLIEVCSRPAKDLNKCLHILHCPWNWNVAKIQLLEKRQIIWLMAAWYMLLTVVIFQD